MPLLTEDPSCKIAYNFGLEMGPIVPQDRPFFLQGTLLINLKPVRCALIVINSLITGKNSTFIQRKTLQFGREETFFLKGSHFSRNREALGRSRSRFLKHMVKTRQKWTLIADLLSAHRVTLGSPSPTLLVAILVKKDSSISFVELRRNIYSECKQLRVGWSSILDQWWENVSEWGRADWNSWNDCACFMCSDGGVSLKTG